MDPDETKPVTDEQPATTGADVEVPVVEAPADALSRSPEELAEEKAQQIAANPQPAEPEEKKKVSGFRRLWKRIDIYFLIFVLIVIIAIIITSVAYLNSTKEVVQPGIENQQLTTETLKQLANSDATVGSAAQTLTIRGSAIIQGQTLMRGNLNVAGNIQAGGSLQAPDLTVSGTANLGTVQINSLQVASNTAIQGSTTLRDLSVAGTSTFSGAVTASQITVSRLIMSGNAVLQVPNHLSFTGPTPGRSITSGVLGSGGTASLSGSDTSGTININTGNNPQAGCFVQVTFAQAFAAQPHVIVSPVGVGAGQTQYYVNRSTTGFSLCTAAPAPANQAFAFDYFVAG